MTLADTINSALAAVTPTILGVFPDLCDVTEPGEPTPDGFGGTDDTPVTVASGLKCFREVLKQPKQVMIGGARLVSLTDTLMIEATEEARAINPRQTITVAARDDVAELTFLNPVILDGSFAPVITVGATLSV